MGMGSEGKKKVLVSIPTSPAHPYIHKHVVFTLLRLLGDRRHMLKIILPSHNPFENNLHHIVKDFVEGDYDFWLSIDADNPPTNNPLDLIEFDRDIMGLPTPVWHFTGKKKRERPLYWNAYDYVPEKGAYKEHRPRKGLQKVDAIGTGCFLISKRVFLNKNMQKGAFVRKLNPDGTVNKGNDISFCERAKNEGFEIFAHYDYPCMHFVNLELNEVVRAFRNLYEVK